MGLAILMTAFSVGNIVGPSVGGFTAFLGDQYPGSISKDNILAKFPVLLPNIIIASGLGVGTILAVYLLPKDTPRNGEEEPLLEKTELEENESTYQTYKESKHNDFVLISLQSDCPTTALETMDVSPTSNFSTLINRLKSSDIAIVLSTKECWLSCLIYAAFGLVDFGFNEMFPVLAATDPKLKGMGMTPSQLGTILMVVSVFLIVIQLTVMPKLSNLLGAKNLMIAANLMLSFWMPMLPTICAIKNTTLQWLAIVVVIFVVRASCFCAYLAINIFVQNSADAEVVGSANGLSMMVASVGRVCGPILSGSIYSWSLRNIVGVAGNTDPMGFPFNHFLTFYVLSLGSIGIALITTTFPNSMNYKKK